MKISSMEVYQAVWKYLIFMKKRVELLMWINAMIDSY